MQATQNSKKYEIDPEIHEMPAKQSRYPFQEMQIKQSFTFPRDKMSSVGSASAKFKRKGMKFAVRSINETDADGTMMARCWRVE